MMAPPAAALTAAVEEEAPLDSTRTDPTAHQLAAHQLELSPSCGSMRGRPASQLAVVAIWESLSSAGPSAA